MRAELREIHWLQTHPALSLEELAELSGLAAAELSALIDAGSIAPLDAAVRPWRFGAECLVVARTAVRLRDDFELDTRGLSLALDLLERVRSLEAQLRELQARGRGPTTT